MTCPEVARLRRELDGADIDATRLEGDLAELKLRLGALERRYGIQRQAVKRLEHEIEEIEGGDG